MSASSLESLRLTPVEDLQRHLNNIDAQYAQQLEVCRGLSAQRAEVLEALGVQALHGVSDTPDIRSAVA